MAKITQVTLVDDLDGGAADETVLFGLDGDAYEIDLSEANAQALRDLLALTWTRPVRPKRVRRPASPPPPGPPVPAPVPEPRRR